jgi:hypothetical protein
MMDNQSISHSRLISARAYELHSSAKPGQSCFNSSHGVNQMWVWPVRRRAFGELYYASVQWSLYLIFAAALTACPTLLQPPRHLTPQVGMGVTGGGGVTWIEIATSS